MWIARLITRLASEWGSAGEDRKSELKARRPLLPKAYHNSRDNYLVLLSNNTRRSSYITTANCAALALLTQYDRQLAAAELSLYMMMMMMEASLKICSCIYQKCFAAFLSASFRLPYLCSFIPSFPLLDHFPVAPPQPSSCPTYSQHQPQLIWMSYNPNETHCSLICNWVQSIPCIL